MQFFSNLSANKFLGIFLNGIMIFVINRYVRDSLDEHSQDQQKQHVKNSLLKVQRILSLYILKSCPFWSILGKLKEKLRPEEPKNITAKDIF